MARVAAATGPRPRAEFAVDLFGIRRGRRAFRPAHRKRRMSRARIQRRLAYLNTGIPLLVGCGGIWAMRDKDRYLDIVGGSGREPSWGSACADCSVGTLRLGEWYMLKHAIWEQAWVGRRKPWHVVPGQQVLCIGCLEQRLGRTLTAAEFTAAPCNDPNQRWISERLRDRLTMPA
jgi:hypothetical protein